MTRKNPDKLVPNELVDALWEIVFLSGRGLAAVLVGAMAMGKGCFRYGKTRSF